MQDTIYLEQFESHAAEFAHKTHNKMKAKELEYIRGTYSIFVRE